MTLTIEAVDDPRSALPQPAGVARRLFEPEYAIDYYPTHEALHLVDDGIETLADLAIGRVRTIVRRGDQRAVHIAAHLFFTLPLLELLKRRGRFAIHAAGVVLPEKGERAILIAGASGAGKSTLALACALDGWGFLGDDVVVMGAGEDLSVRGFPDEIDLTQESAAFFPQVGAIARAAAPAGSKRPISPLDIRGLHVAESANPIALVFPDRGTSGMPERLDADDAFERLVPNVVRTDARGAQAHLDVLAGLARRVPAYRMALGDPAAAPAVLRRLAEGAA
jgi:hypothetical protein